LKVIICTIKENAWVAKLAARNMRSRNIAIVFGSTINLYGVSREAFLADTGWVRHEVCHVRQYRHHGFAWFLLQYVWQWLRVGYYDISFEKEARLAENDPSVMDGVRIL
jgi:hypothetical protein